MKKNIDIFLIILIFTVVNTIIISINFQKVSTVTTLECVDTVNMGGIDNLVYFIPNRLIGYKNSVVIENYHVYELDASIYTSSSIDNWKNGSQGVFVVPLMHSSVIKECIFKVNTSEGVYIFINANMLPINKEMLDVKLIIE